MNLDNYKEYFSKIQYIDYWKKYDLNIAETTIFVLLFITGLLLIICFGLALIYMVRTFYIIAYILVILLLNLSIPVFIIYSDFTSNYRDKYSNWRRNKLFYEKYNVTLKEEQLGIKQLLSSYLNKIDEYIENELLQKLLEFEKLSDSLQYFKVEKSKIQSHLSFVTNKHLRHQINFDSDKAKRINFNLNSIFQMITTEIKEQIEKDKNDKKNKLREFKILKENEIRNWNNNLIKKESRWQELKIKSEQNRNLQKLINSNKSIIISRNLDWSLINEKKIKHGKIGEFVVFENEKIKLSNLNINKSPEHVSQSIGDGLGYDIKSYNVHGDEILIEVKSTIKKQTKTFMLSANELKTMKNNLTNYFIYLVTNLDIQNKTGKIQIIKASEILNNSSIEANNFTVKL